MINEEQILFKTKKNTSKIKHNPIYLLFTQFYSDDLHKIVNPNKLSKLKNHNAYKITIDITSNFKNLFSQENYTLKDAHLRIDETYKSSLHGLAMAHYTEEYVNSDSNFSITLHVYYKHNGQYQNFEIKKKNLETNETQLLSVDTKDRNAVLANIMPATHIIGQLMQYKANLYAKKLQVAYNIDTKLSTLIREMQAKFNIEKVNEYKTIAQEFFSVINEINLLNELSIDTRDIFVKKTIENLNERLNADIPNILDNEPIEDHLCEAQNTISISSKPLPKKDKNESIIIEAKEKIAQCKRMEQVKDSKTYLLLNELLIDLQILNIQLLGNSMGKQISKAINNIKDYLTQTAHTFIQGSDLINLQAIFDVAKDYISHEFYSDFLESLMQVNIEKEEEQIRMQNSIAVCDFLYIKSDLFKHVAFLSANQYFISKDRESFCSYLYILYVRSNFPLFKALISYGANCNIGIHILSSKKTIPLINMLLENSKLSDDNSIDNYINYLIDNHTILMTPNNFSSLYLIHMIDFKNILTAKKPDQSLDYNKLWEKIYNVHPLDLYLNSNPKANISLLKLLINNSSISNITYSLATIISYEGTRIAYFNSSTMYGLYLFDDVDARNIFNTEHKSDNDADKLCITCYYSKEMLPCSTEQLQCLYSIWQEKTAKLTTAEISNIVEQMIVITADCQINNITKLIYAISGLILLSLYPQPPLDVSKKVLALILKMGDIHDVLGNSFGVCSFYFLATCYISASSFKNLLLGEDKNGWDLNATAYAVQLILINLDKQLNSLICSNPFVKLKLNSEIPGSNGFTLLHYASKMLRYDCIKVLIEHGANNLSKSNSNGITPISFIPDIHKRGELITLSVKQAMINKPILKP